MAENPETARQIVLIVFTSVMVGLAGPATAQDRGGGSSSKSWADEVRSAVGNQKPAGGAAGGNKASGGQSGGQQQGGAEKGGGGGSQSGGAAGQGGGERR
jgi:hypothetical protein